MKIAAMHNTWLESKVTTPNLFAGLPCYFALLNKSRMLRTPCQQTPKTHTDKRLHKIDLLSVWKRGIYIYQNYIPYCLYVWQYAYIKRHTTHVCTLHKYSFRKGDSSKVLHKQTGYFPKDFFYLDMTLIFNVHW